MSENGSLKRKSGELEKENNVAEQTEPELKQLKVEETEMSKPNLENVFNKEENNETNIPEDVTLKEINQTSIPEENNETNILEEGEVCPTDNGPTIPEESINPQELEPCPPLVAENNEADISKLPSSKEPHCCISIKFHDDLSAELYRAKFLYFIYSTFPDLHVASNNSNDIDVYKKDECVVILSGGEEVKEASSSTKKRKKHAKAKKELFVVDATPSPTTAKTEFKYTTKFTINSEKVEDNGLARKSAQTCFNCDGVHSLRDCSQPKDQVRISAARQKFQLGKTRYHMEENQKYGHLAPGKISSELRKALGLHKNEAPHYIYLMRRLGYPPGWLEEAKIVHSNLDMFDIDGKNVKSMGKKKRGLDENKIVDYPGFNVPFQKGVADDYQMYRVSPYSDDFSKQAMINFFDKKFAQEEDDLETCDMDIDHEPDLIVEKVTKVEERTSPSLVDLEEQKQHLLEELQTETKEVLIVKESTFGTPILKSNSPYTRLPNPDNFSKDVSPVICFENLPNSTGKYEQLTDVLQKVRNTLKKSHSCSS